MNETVDLACEDHGEMNYNSRRSATFGVMAKEGRCESKAGGDQACVPLL